MNNNINSYLSKPFQSVNIADKINIAKKNTIKKIISNKFKINNDLEILKKMKNDNLVLKNVLKITEKNNNTILQKKLLIEAGEKLKNLISEILIKKQKLKKIQFELEEKEKIQENKILAIDKKTKFLHEKIFKNIVFLEKFKEIKIEFQNKLNSLEKENNLNTFLKNCK